MLRAPICPFPQPQHAVATRHTLRCVQAHVRSTCIKGSPNGARSSQREPEPTSPPVPQALVLAAGLVATATFSAASPPPVRAAAPPPSTATNVAPAKGKRTRGSDRETQQQQQQQQQQQVLTTVPAGPQHQPAPPLAAAAAPALLALLAAATYVSRRRTSPSPSPINTARTSTQDATALSHALRAASGRTQGLLHVLGSRTSSRGGILAKGLIGAGQSLRGMKPIDHSKRGTAEGVRAGAGADTLERPHEQQQQQQQQPALSEINGRSALPPVQAVQQSVQQPDGRTLLERERRLSSPWQSNGGEPEDGGARLSFAEEILQWRYAIQCGTEEEAAETICAANKLAEALLTEADRAQPGPGSNAGATHSELAGSEADVRWRKYDGIAQLVDFMGGLPEQLEARTWKELWQPLAASLSIDTATPDGAAEFLRTLAPTDPSSSPSLGGAVGVQPSVPDSQQQQEQQQQAVPGSKSAEVVRAAEHLWACAQAAADASKMQGLVLCVGAAARELEAGWQAQARVLRQQAETEAALIAVEGQAAALRAAAERQVQESRRKEAAAREARREQGAGAAAAGEAKRRAQAAVNTTEEEHLLRAAAAAAAAAEEEEKQLQAAAAAAGEEQRRAHAAAAAAAAEEERQQAEVRAAAQERQQQRHAALEADWAARRAAWGARKAAAESERREALKRAQAAAREAAMRVEARAQDQRWRETAARLDAENAAERESWAARARVEEQQQREQEEKGARVLREHQAQEARRVAEAHAAVLAEEARAAARAEEELRRAAAEAEAAQQRLVAQEREAKQRMLRAQEAVAEAQARAAYATSQATGEASAARASVAAEAQAYASQLAKAADMHWALAQQAVLAARSRAERTQATLEARRSAALQRVRAKDEEQASRACARAQAEAPPRLRSGSLADWAPGFLRANKHKPGLASKYDPLEQLVNESQPQPQWQEVAHEVLSLEAVVGSGLPRYSPTQVMSAAHPGMFVDALQDMERLLAQPKRLAKVHPAISAWIQVSSDAAVAQQRQTAPSWKLWPIWVSLHGPQHQQLYDATLKAWPTFAAELEHRHSTLHKLVCRGTESRLDPEGNRVRGLALLATLAAWRGTAQHSSCSNGASASNEKQLEQLEQLPGQLPGQSHNGSFPIPLVEKQEAEKREAVGAGN